MKKYNIHFAFSQRTNSENNHERVKKYINNNDNDNNKLQ